MPTEAVQAAINDQITMELESAYVYLSMAAYFDEHNLPGFSHWMRMQHEEELAHAMKLFDFMLDNGGHIVLSALSKPPSQFKGALAVMKQSLQHERKVTAAITKLYELAVKEKDYPAQILLQWFIAEQTEEEKTVGDIIAQMEMVGDSGSGLLLIDQQLAGRSSAGVEA
ncbi:MAG: ferritin [Gemmatimonadota bacterium]|nr:MAG: ferritin [Gemmatimonadota bacterium]